MSFNIEDALQIAEAAPERIPYRVEGLLTKVGLSLLVAKPKAGKSTFARQLAVAVAEEKSFLGSRTTRCDVLYLHLEGSREMFGQHIKKLGLTKTRGKIWCLSGRMPNSLKLGLAELTKALESYPDVGLVVIDPLPKFLRVSDGDSYSEVGSALETLEQFAAENKIHILCLAHAKKRATDDAGDSPIGSTAFRGGTDTNIFLRKQGTDRIIETEQRWGASLEPTVLLFDAETQSMSLGFTVEKQEESRQESRKLQTTDRIEREIKDALLLGSLNTAELLQRVSGKNQRKYEVLEQLKADGVITADQDGNAIRYRLVEMEEEGIAA